MRQVVFDSSFLMAVAERPTTWEGDITSLLGKYRAVTLDCVLSELVILAAAKGKRAKLAGVAMQLAKAFAVFKSGGARVDDEITSYALGHSAAVATQDGELLKSLRNLRVPAVTLRKGRTALA